MWLSSNSHTFLFSKVRYSHSIFFLSSLSPALLLFIDSTSFITFHWLVDVYTYALGVLILKEWLSNGGQLKSDTKLGLFLIFVNLVYWDFALLIFRIFGGIRNVFNMLTRWAAFCHVSISLVILGYVLRCIVPGPIWLGWVVAGSCSARWGVHQLWQAPSSQARGSCACQFL